MSHHLGRGSRRLALRRRQPAVRRLLAARRGAPRGRPDRRPGPRPRPRSPRPRCSTLHHVFEEPSLNALMARGPRGSARRYAAGSPGCSPTRPSATSSSRTCVPLADVTLHLPVEVADYVDFYASEHHASNVGRIFRPDQEPLLPNWKHLPGRLPRPRRHRRRRRARRWSARRASGRRRPRRRPDVRAERAPRHRGRARLRRRHRLHARRPGRRTTRSPTTSSASSASTTGRRATSRPGSTSRSARSSASPSPPRSRTGSPRSRRSTPPGSTCPGQDPTPLPYLGPDRGAGASTSTSRSCSTARSSAGRRTARCTGPRPRCSPT